MVFTIAGVTGERHTGAASFTHITKDHGLNVNRSAPFVWYFLNTTVFNGAFTIPAGKYGTYTTPHLFPGIIREFST